MGRSLISREEWNFSVVVFSCGGSWDGLQR